MTVYKYDLISPRVCRLPRMCLRETEKTLLCFNEAGVGHTRLVFMG